MIIPANLFLEFISKKITGNKHLYIGILITIVCLIAKEKVNYVINIMMNIVDSGNIMSWESRKKREVWLNVHGPFLDYPEAFLPIISHETSMESGRSDVCLRAKRLSGI